MNNSNRVAELKRQIAEHEASRARLAQELAFQESLNHDQLGNNKMSARSQSAAGYAVTTPLMSQPSNDDPAPKRQRRALSQQMSQQMSRNASNRSQIGPFLHTGASLQPLLAPSCALPNAEQPQISAFGEQDGTVPMPDVGVRPDIFLAGLSPDHPYIPASNADFSHLDLDQTMPISKCPSMISGWSAGDGPNPITRQNSIFGDNIMPGAESVDMSRWASESQSSRGFDDIMFSEGQQVKNPYMEHDCLGLGANLVSAGMTRSFSSSIRSQTLLSPPESNVDSVVMERSDSNDSSYSVRSNASSKRRHKEALERVIKASQGTTLAPKPQSTIEPKLKAVTPAKREGKVAVPPKPAYTRRKPVKVYCTQCTEHPEGFRGDHELRRHCLSKHEATVKKFICRDPTSVGIATNLKVIKPLSDCKACRAQKLYGAYYNAAAHLRRQHFKPRPSRSKGKSEEKRGGKGGGDWPPMHELKDWFEVRRVPAKQAGPADIDQDENEVGPTQDDMEGFDMPYDPHLTLNFDLGQIGDGSILSMNPPADAAAEPFDLNQFTDISPVQDMMAGFMDDGRQLYSSSFAPANAITQSNLQDMEQVPW